MPDNQKLGRPPKLTPALQTTIAGCIFDGLTDEETALLTDVAVKTIVRARAGNFCPAIKKATLARKQYYVRKVRDGTGRDWTRIAWFLERRYPTEFCRPEIALQLNTTNQTVNNTLIVTAEVAHQMSARVKDADAKVTELFKRKNPQQLKNGNGNGKEAAK